MRGASLVVAVSTVLVAVAGCFGGAEDGVAPTDVALFADGLVWTGDAARSEAEALAVRNGTLVGVGSTSDLRARFPGAIEVSLGGRRVVPGLMDSHSHFVRIAANWTCDPANNPFEPTYDASALAGTEYEVSRAQIGLAHEETNRTGHTPVDDHFRITDTVRAKAGLVCAMRYANAMGLTLNVEAGIASMDYHTILQELEAEGRITLRHALYITPPFLEEARQHGIVTGTGTDLVQISGIKYYSDGWLGPRTSALIAPYSDRPWSRGVLFLEQPEADLWTQRAKEAGLKVATHTIGDHGVAVMLNAYTKALAGENGSDYRYSLEHAQVLRPDFIDKILAIGGVISYQLSFATTDQRFAESALGAERLRTSYVWKTLYDRGVILAGGSDFPIEVLPPLWGIQRIVTRQELDGTPPGGWQPDQKLSVEEALRTITWNAAYNVFMEDRLGSLEEGKLADFVVLDRDILTIPPNEIAKTCVHSTYLSGLLVYSEARDHLCSTVKYNGILPPRDPAVIEAIHERMEAENLGFA